MARFVYLALLLRCIVAKEMYCGDDNCYDLLGVPRRSSDADIKKAYRKMALKYHPDKNQAADASETFAKMAKAFEVLSSKLLRKAYDYYLDHPEERLKNMYNYTMAVYQPKVPPWYVMLGFLVFFSGLQYINDGRIHAQTMRYITVQPAFKRRVNERADELAGKKKLSKVEKAQLREQAEQEILKSEVQVDGAGSNGASVSSLLVVKLMLSPIFLGQAIYEQARWFWLFSVQGRDYGEAEQSYMTQRALAIPAAKWGDLDGETQQALLARKLWDRENREAFFTEEKETEERGKKGLLTTYKRQVGKRMQKEDDYYD